jgi:hypothetical protein
VYSKIRKTNFEFFITKHFFISSGKMLQSTKLSHLEKCYQTELSVADTVLLLGSGKNNEY